MSNTKLKNKPLILINFKTYLEVSGNKSLTLAQKISKVKSSKYQIALAPPTLYLKDITTNVNLPIFAQHLDPEGEGAHTGHIIPYEAKKIGITGTILNHSEKKIPFQTLEATVHACKHHGLVTIVCASSLAELRKIAPLHPEYIAYEPPELIGGKISVTHAKPELIRRAVNLVQALCPKTKVLCGAGVHSKEDLLHALKLGTSGVLIGHAVPKAKNPVKFLRELLG